MPDMRQVWVAIAAIGTIGAGGCSAATSDDIASQASPVDFSTARLEEAHRAFGYRENYSLLTVAIEGNGEWRWTTEQRLHDATAECMDAAGFPSYPPIQFTREQLTASFQQPVLLPLTEADASTLGYGPSVSEAKDASAEGDLSTDPAFAEKNLRCSITARDKVFDGNFDAYESSRSQLENLRVAFFDSFWASDEVQALMRDWSACIQRAGYSFESPYDSRKAAEGLAVDASFDLAKADARCRAEGRFDPELLALFDAADANFVLTHEQLIVALMSMRPGLQ